ncbi:hypothetical protein BpHYR1_012668 [Brachionus plicatilis]|uniref:Uncharacterized protein n=1 Tax=Brachionus plicatilis TaxID=10195 RepID=A0A3M7Q6V8_BRAPC|nr:hypothetical protein BpHYR1_012668 [Brachionus plicatilis]
MMMLILNAFTFLLFHDLNAVEIQENELEIKTMLDPAESCHHLIHFSKVYSIYFPLNQMSVQINFNNFENNKQIQLKCFNNKKISVISMTFVPKRSLILDNGLNMHLNTHLADQIGMSFVFYQGIESNLNIFEYFYEKNIQINIKFYYSNFGYQNQLNKICLFTDKIIFRIVKILFYSISTRYVPFSCPIVFYKCTIFLLRMDVNFDLDSKIHSLDLTVYQSKLNHNILDANVFAQLQTLVINVLDNMDTFLFQSLKWIDAINSHPNYSEVTIDLRRYDFPQTDLCLFKDLPRNRKILFFFTEPNCSCTVLWLYKIYYHQDGFDILNGTFGCLNLLWLNATCDFDFLHCPQLLRKKYQLSDIDVFYISEYLNLITVLISPCFAVLGLITNLFKKIFASHNYVNMSSLQGLEHGHKRKDGSTLHSIIILVSINILILLRSLEFGLNILVLKFKVAKSPCDSINKICTNIYQAGNIFYLISCSYSTALNTVFLYKFLYVMCNALIFTR